MLSIAPVLALRLVGFFVLLWCLLGKPLPANAQLQAEVTGPESVQLSLQRYVLREGSDPPLTLLPSTGDKLRCTFETSKMNGNYIISIKYASFSQLHISVA